MQRFWPLTLHHMAAKNDKSRLPCESKLSWIEGSDKKFFLKSTAEQRIVKRLKTKILKFPFCSWPTIHVADSQHGLARRLHQVTWPVSTNWNASSPDSQSWKAMSRIAGDSPRFPGNLTTPGSSHRPCCSLTTLVCFCLGFPGWAGLCLFCQHLSLLKTF